MQADNSDRWTCRKCGVTFTRQQFVQHVRADACNAPRHVGQLIHTLRVFDRLLYHENGRAHAFHHAGERGRR